jgi:hypothetical protein
MAAHLSMVTVPLSAGDRSLKVSFANNDRANDEWQ